jgi:hypothetical protein
MANITIAVINVSTVLTDEMVAVAVPDLATQIHRDFAPAWGIDADLVVVGPNEQIPSGAWWLILADTSDQANALGYHDVSLDGLPIGKVFAKSDIDAGASWTVTASHELLEMLADPAINLTVFAQKENGGCRFFAYEVCDPCEADTDGYVVGQTLVSDFVFPSWFEAFREPGTKFDYLNLIQAPFRLRVGGYISFNDIIDGIGWQMMMADTRPNALSLRPRVGSRRERRRTNRLLWEPSTATQRPPVAATRP